MVAVILENFTALGSLNADLVSMHDIADFKEAWGAYDPDADGLIPVELMPKVGVGVRVRVRVRTLTLTLTLTRTQTLPQLVSDVPPPLGTRGAAAGARARAIRLCVGLGLHTVDGKVQFREVLDALIQVRV